MPLYICMYIEAHPAGFFSGYCMEYNKPPKSPEELAYKLVIKIFSKEFP